MPEGDRMTANMTAGAALLNRLKRLGVDYIFANSGTDFPPIIEGLAQAAAGGMELPVALTVPHETAAVAMAHGYYLGSGRGQAVMVHTNVGLANAAIGAINARADNVPMLLFSGRTPTTEKGRFGSRTVPIGWGQEMFDQTALVREACKWDYELRFAEQVFDLADRAYGIAHSTPRGPVYLSLPREPLCESIPANASRPQMQPAISAGRPKDVEQAAQLIASAQFPVIFAQRGAGSPKAFDALGKIADRFAIPVCQYWALQLAIPTDHPMATGPDPAPLLAKADVIIVIDALAPWSPDAHEPRGDAQIIQIGQDPLFSQTPVRNFRSDLSIPGDVSTNILALAQALDAISAPQNEQRRSEIIAANQASWQKRDEHVQQDATAPSLTKKWISGEIAHATQTKDATIFAELGCQLPFIEAQQAGLLVRKPPLRRPWLRTPRRHGLPPRPTRKTHNRHHRRRLLHVRQPRRLPPGDRSPQAQHPRHHPQQQRMGCGSTLSGRPLPQRPRRQEKHHAPHRPLPLPRLHQNRPSQPRLGQSRDDTTGIHHSTG